MKSIAMWDQGRSGMGRGWRRPAGTCREGFWVLQTWQWLTWEIVSFLRVGHQKRFWSSCIVALMPGWPELRAAWTSAMVLSRRVSGTNNLFSGQSGGIFWVELACSISVVMSHWMGAMTTVGEIIFSGGLGSESSANCRDNASALTFFVPGWYVTIKSNRVKNNDHLACLGEQSLDIPNCDGP